MIAGCSNQCQSTDASIEINNEIVAGSWWSISLGVRCEFVHQRLHQTTVSKYPIAYLATTINAICKQLLQHVASWFEPSTTFSAKFWVHAAEIFVDVHHFVVS